MGKIDLAKVIAYESDTLDIVHPTCYREASRTYESRWRRLGMRAMERLHTKWPKGAKCAVCGGRGIIR